MNKKIFLLISLIFTFVFTHRLSSGEFLFISDQFFPFSLREISDTALTIFAASNLGYITSWQAIVQFWDSLFFIIIYSLGINFIWAEKIHFFFTLFITFNFSFVGLKKLGELFSLKVSKYKVFLISLLYCFNPYTLALWHGGVYNIGSALTYSLAPLIIYYFHISVFKKSSLQTKLICAVTLFFASFVFWLFAVLAFVLILYSVSYLVLERKRNVALYAKNLFELGAAYLPLASVVVFSILYKYINIEGSRDPMAQPGFGNQQGGLFYQLKFFFSWGIYTLWSPRTLYFFGDYFFTAKYNLGVAILYAFTVIGVLFSIFPRFLDQVASYPYAQNFIKAKDKIERRPVLIFIILFCVSLFFAKANQPPLGGIFIYLYENLPLFSVFRNADIRFGFAIILCLSVLVLFSSRYVRKLPLAVIISSVILLISWNLVNGSAIMGLNVVKFVRQYNDDVTYIDRIVSVPNDYSAVADTLNILPQDSGYIYSTPSVQYGHFDLGDVGTYVGPDLLSKIVNRQFIYTSSDSSNIATLANNEIQAAVANHDFEAVKNFPIKYFLYRKDVICAGCEIISKGLLQSEYKLISENEMVSLYEVPNSTPVVDVRNVTFKKVSPTKYVIDFQKITDVQDIKFLQSYSQKWQLYLNRDREVNCERVVEHENNLECESSLNLLDFRNLQFLFAENLFDETHEYLYGYANKWEVSPEFIKENFDDIYYTTNEDGSLNFQITIFYYDQAWYLLSLLVSTVLLVTYSILIWKWNLKKGSIAQELD